MGRRPERPLRFDIRFPYLSGGQPPNFNRFRRPWKGLARRKIDGPGRPARIIATGTGIKPALKPRYPPDAPSEKAKVRLIGTIIGYAAVWTDLGSIKPG